MYCSVVVKIDQLNIDRLRVKRESKENYDIIFIIVFDGILCPSLAECTFHLFFLFRTIG